MNVISVCTYINRALLSLGFFFFFSLFSVIHCRKAMIYAFKWNKMQYIKPDPNKNKENMISKCLDRAVKYRPQIQLQYLRN